MAVKKKILLIEDNAPIRENTVELLELSDYEVIIAQNGKEGIEIACIETPDLILCDIMMPEMDGYAVLKYIRNESPIRNTPLIFFTASSEKKQLEEGLKMGADAYIVKPFDSDELIQLIERHIR
ncbi:MAG TPA: response regulator [Chitinophagaceae bacterium]|nr:response regulator [Chitinophagaceae bacterium]